MELVHSMTPAAGIFPGFKQPAHGHPGLNSAGPAGQPRSLPGTAGYPKLYKPPCVCSLVAFSVLASLARTPWRIESLLFCAVAAALLTVLIE